MLVEISVNILVTRYSHLDLYNPFHWGLFLIFFFFCSRHGQATHFALSFGVPGWDKEKEAVMATVLQVPNSNTTYSLLVNI